MQEKIIHKKSDYILALKGNQGNLPVEVTDFFETALAQNLVRRIINQMLTIIDYGLGNIASVQNMLRRVGGQAKISNEPDDLSNASALILPGVGSFDHGVKQLHSQGLFSAIQELVMKGVPILGICLGMQLLAKKSDEGTLNGFGFINAEFKRFSFNKESTLKIPHVGWNNIKVVRENPLIFINKEPDRFYFTHSYHAVCADETDIIAVAEYGDSFPAAYWRNNVFGVQFHPEKSHRFGMELLKKFLEVTC